MKAYISVSYSKREVLKHEISAIKIALSENNIKPFVFVEEYSFTNVNEKEMMQQAMNDIDNCDFLIAEVTDKAIGIGVEVGYAKAKYKTVIYIRNEAAEHSTTVSGCSDYRIIYQTSDDLKISLSQLIKNIKLQ